MCIIIHRLCAVCTMHRVRVRVCAIRRVHTAHHFFYSLFIIYIYFFL